MSTSPHPPTKSGPGVGAGFSEEAHCDCVLKGLWAHPRGSSTESPQWASLSRTVHRPGGQTRPRECRPRKSVLVGCRAPRVTSVEFLSSPSLWPLESKTGRGGLRTECLLEERGQADPTGQRCQDLDRAVSQSCNSFLLVYLLLQATGDKFV